MTAYGYTGLGGVSDIFFDASPSTMPYIRGRVFYDGRDEVDALSFYDSHNAPPVHLGREIIIAGYNDSGAIIQTGSALCVTGNHAGSRLPNIGLARANAESTAYVIGLAAHDIPINDIGHLHMIGILHQDISLVGYSAGAELFLSTTVPGGWTTTKPTAPNWVTRLGVVTRPGANGAIFVNVRQAVPGV